MKLFGAFLFFLLVCLDIRGQVPEVVDSLKLRLASTTDMKDKAITLIRLTYQYAWSKPDSAIFYGLQGLRLSQESGFLEQEILIMAPISEALCMQGNFSKALELDLKSLRMAEQSGKENLISTSMTALAGVYFYSGDYQKALATSKLLLQAPSAGNQITPDYSGPSETVFGFIGEAYYHLGDIDSAELYIDRAYRMDEKRLSHWSIPYYYKALIHSRRQQYNEALDNFRKGLRYSQYTTLDQVDGYIGIALIFQQLGQIDSAIFYAKEAIKHAQRERISPRVIDAAWQLTQLYANKNNDSAFHYQKIMVSAKDSLFSQEKVRQLQNVSFNEQLRQQEIQREEKETENKERIYVLLTGLSLFLLTTFFLWRNNRHKQKAYMLLQSQKRELDIQKETVDQTLAELQSTQAQLIQSEKMASLGELTAGIAHEIQNPLNFVNNFSEVSNELIDEMVEEVNKGNFDEAKAIALDVKKNLDKINHHGKRADGIVKNMLQHSQSGSSQKELTDINQLCDEYIRLSYHGLRAKDKSFNTKVETYFDPTLEKINVIPQEIGRVVLNLVNNAFYAANEKKNNNVPGFEPKISITTKKQKARPDDPLGRGKIEISVRDNGTGIAQKVLDKIFQPFFTTKPTGQGTGLGLSLSYDIVKVHGGELKVETKEGEGSKFEVHLPV